MSHRDRSDPESIKARVYARPGFTLIELLVVISIIVLLLIMLIPAVKRAKESARYQGRCFNCLKSIALALSNYESDHGVLPPAYTVDAQGRPLHSWRTLILPYMKQKALYDTIDLTKPWDDPVNAAALATAVLDYHCQQSSGPANTTMYRAVVGLNACFLPDRPRRLDEITDDPGQTLMVIEADEESAVPWMAPVDTDTSLILRLGPKSKTAHSGVLNAVFADGQYRLLKLDLAPEIRQGLVTIAGGEELDPDTP